MNVSISYSVLVGIIAQQTPVQNFVENPVAALSHPFSSLLLIYGQPVLSVFHIINFCLMSSLVICWVQIESFAEFYPLSCS